MMLKHHLNNSRCVHSLFCFLFFREHPIELSKASVSSTTIILNTNLLYNAIVVVVLCFLQAVLCKILLNVCD